MTREETQGSKTDAQPSASRRPYRTPRLRHLGSVRELTLGQTKGAFDDGNGMMLTPKGM
jgi:hypothetical protein